MSAASIHTAFSHPNVDADCMHYNWKHARSIPPAPTFWQLPLITPVNIRYRQRGCSTHRSLQETCMQPCLSKTMDAACTAWCILEHGRSLHQWGAWNIHAQLKDACQPAPGCMPASNHARSLLSPRTYMQLASITTVNMHSAFCQL